MGRILSILLIVNIVQTIYLFYLLSSIRKDVNLVKEKLIQLSSFAKDTWDITVGSIPRKISVVAKHGKKLKDMFKIPDMKYVYETKDDSINLEDLKNENS